MSYDGSGTYSLPSPEYPAVPGALIKAADFNAIMLDLAAALSLCLVRDGQALATGNLNMNSKKIVGLAAGSSPGDAVRFEQLPAALTAALTALNALTPAADKFPFFTAADAADQLTIVAAVRAVLAAADVSAMRTAMGVAYGAIAGTVSEGNHLHTGVYQPAGAYAASGANSDITSLSGLTTPLSVVQGGTGGTTASNARTALGLKSAALLDATALAQIGVVNAYTRQQYAVPVVLTAQNGAIALDADLHQDIDITATGAVTFGAPANAVRGKTIFMTLYAASALAITWNAAFKPNADNALDTAFAAGKRIFLHFRCVDGANWLLMGRTKEA